MMISDDDKITADWQTISAINILNVTDDQKIDTKYKL